MAKFFTYEERLMLQKLLKEGMSLVRRVRRIYDKEHTHTPLGYFSFLIIYPMRV